MGAVISCATASFAPTAAAPAPRATACIRSAAALEADVTSLGAGGLSLGSGNGLSIVRYPAVAVDIVKNRFGVWLGD